MIEKFDTWLFDQIDAIVLWFHNHHISRIWLLRVAAAIYILGAFVTGSIIYQVIVFFVGSILLLGEEAIDYLNMDINKRNARTVLTRVRFYSSLPRNICLICLCLSFIFLSIKGMVIMGTYLLFIMACDSLIPTEPPEKNLTKLWKSYKW